MGELFPIHLNTFRSVFPHATLWYSYGSDQALLLATPELFTLDAQRMQQKLDRLPGWFRAHDFQIDTVSRLSGFFWLDEAKMSDMIGKETRVNTDDINYFSNQSALWPVPPQRRLAAFQADLSPYLLNADEKLRNDVKSEQHVAQLVANFWFFHDADQLLAANCLMPRNGKVLFWMAAEFPDGAPKMLCK